MTYAFISYVRENSKEVDRLKANLEANGVIVWLDREQIRPGADWKQAIRNAIKEGAYFIACFSTDYIRREQSHMNEELNLAIDEIRTRPFHDARFIPVRIDECVIPTIAIGGNRFVADFQRVDFFEDPEKAAKIISAVIAPPLTFEEVQSIKQRQNYYGAKSLSVNETRTASATSSESPRAPGTDGNSARLADRVAAEWEEWKDIHETGLAQFWMAVVPDRVLDIDLSNRRLRELMVRPELSGNLDDYYSVFQGLERHGAMRLRAGVLTVGDVQTGELRVHRDGVMTFRSDRHRLQPPFDGGRKLHALTLLGLIVSFHRFACELLKSEKIEVGDLVASLAEFFANDESELERGSPFRTVHFDRSGTLVAGQPHRFESVWPGWPIPTQNPDGCAYPLVKRIYEGFGLFEESIPSIFDRVTRRLTLPS